jgi:hypothetical protein
MRKDHCRRRQAAAAKKAAEAERQKKQDHTASRIDSKNA